MAKKPMKNRAAARGQKKSFIYYVILLVFFVAMFSFALPSMLILFAAMIPTLVALVVEKGHNRYAWICVGSATFAAVYPYLMQLWMHDPKSIAYAIDILGSVTTWLVMYLGAAFGWGIYSVTSPVVRMFIDFLIKRRIASQLNIQRKLIEQWGEDVSGTGYSNNAPEA